MNKAVFLDRDGVINAATVVGNRSYSPDSIQKFIFLPGVKKTITLLREWGYLVIVVTNQPDISRGLLTREELDKMHDLVRKELSVNDIIICTHDDNDGCDCRKPKPGMLLGAAKKWNIDFGKSFLVGDRWRDVEAGKAVNCRTILLKNEASGICDPDYVIKDFSEVAEIILRTTD